MSYYNWCVLGAAAAVVGIGCSSAGGSNYQPKPVKKIPPASVKPGEEKSIMPFVKGNQWTYEVTAAVQTQRGQSGPQKAVVIYTVKDVKPNAAGDGQIATMEVRAENTAKVGDVQVWEINKKGLFQRSISLKNVPFNPPLPAILFPPEPGRKFTWSGTGIVARNVVGRSTIKNTILAPIEVDTQEGRVSAIPVESEITYADKKYGVSRSVVFLSPGIGIVRYKLSSASPTGRTEQMLELKRKVLKTN